MVPRSHAPVDHANSQPGWSSQGLGVGGNRGRVLGLSRTAVSPASRKPRWGLTAGDPCTLQDLGLKAHAKTPVCRSAELFSSAAGPAPPALLLPAPSPIKAAEAQTQDETSAAGRPSPGWALSRQIATPAPPTPARQKADRTALPRPTGGGQVRTLN